MQNISPVVCCVITETATVNKSWKLRLTLGLQLSASLFSANLSTIHENITAVKYKENAEYCMQ